MAEAKKQPVAKSMDVAKPGSTAPSASSRPIIVSNKPPVTDSVILKEEPKEEAKLVSHAGLTLQPTSKPEGEKPTEPSKTVVSGEQVSSDNGEVDALADAVAEKSKKKEEDKADAEKDKQIQKLINQKTYFVKISDGASGSPFARVFVFLLITILLALVVANFLADADVVELPVDPLTNLL